MTCCFTRCRGISRCGAVFSAACGGGTGTAAFVLGMVQIADALWQETFMLPYVFVYIGYALAVGLAIWLAFDAAWLEIVFVVGGRLCYRAYVFRVVQNGTLSAESSI